MYLRFVVPEVAEDSNRELGIFHAVGNLRRRGELYAHEEEEHDRVREWFNQNLEKPTRFTVSKPPYYRKQSKAICWFKDDAHEHIAQARSLVAILKCHGIQVRTVKTDRPGYVAYEDEFQVAAVPFEGERQS